MHDTGTRPGLARIRQAAEAIRGIAERTPLVRSDLDPGLWLKLETLQPTGAFKLRGAAAALSRLPKETPGVVCCSTGNHGRAVAHAGRALGIPVTVCLSELVPEGKRAAIAALGARVVVHGRSQDDAQEGADRLAAAEGLTGIPPFDHADVIAGQGTVALEILADRPEIATLLVPLSGGGLAAGVALAAKALNPGIRVVGLSMDRGAAMAESLRADRPVPVTEVASLADSLGGGIGAANRLTFAICRDLLDEVVLLSEDEIYRGMQALFYRDRLVAEGAGAVAHAAIAAGKVTLDGPAAAIVSGRNVDMAQLAAIVAGRPVRLGEVTVEGRAWTTS